MPITLATTDRPSGQPISAQARHKRVVGISAGSAPVHHLVPGPLTGLVRRPPRRHRKLRQRTRGQGPRPRHRHRRLSTIAGFYKYAVEEELLDHSPAAHVRRPRVDYESHAAALDRNELGALLVAAGLGPPPEHALISLLALNGLRISEATGADIEHLGLERGHRTLTITRKGGKVVTIPLAPRTARAIDLAIGERTGGPVFLAADGRRLDRHGAGRIVRRTARRAGIGKVVTPHTLRHGLHHRRPGRRGAAAGRARGGLARGPAHQSGSPGALPRRGPFRTGQAGFPRITAQASPVALRLMRWSSRRCVSSTRRG